MVLNIAFNANLHGQILLSGIVRALVGTRKDYRFTDVGPLSLKGLAEPVITFELQWR